MGGSSKEDTKTTTQILTPEQQRLASLASGNYEKFAATSPTLPGAAGVADFDSAQVAGQEQVLGSVGQAADTVNSANAQNQQFTSGAYLDPDNPSTQGAIRAAVRPLTDTYRDITLPGIAADASTSGTGGISANFGGSRQGIAEGLATRDLNNKISDTAGTIANQARLTNLNSTLQAIGQAPQIAASSTIPGGITSTVGDVRQGQTQAKLDATTQAEQFKQFLPLLMGQWLAQGASGLPGGGTQSVGSSSSQSDPFSTLIGGASAAGGLAGGLGKLLPLFMTSARELKENIVRIGTLPNGLPWYSFNYIGDSALRQGVMADEVEKVLPDAVYRNASGHTVVDYSQVLEG